MTRGQEKLSKLPDSEEEVAVIQRFSSETTRGHTCTEPRLSFDKDPLLKKSLLKRATGRINESHGGLERIKNAMSIRGHRQHKSKDEKSDSPSSPLSSNDSRPSLRRMSSAPPTSQPTSPTKLRKSEESSEALLLKERPAPRRDGVFSSKPWFAKVISETPIESTDSFTRDASLTRNRRPEFGGAFTPDEDFSPFHTHTATAAPSDAGSISYGVDLNEKLPRDDKPGGNIGTHLLRAQSFSQYEDNQHESRNSSWWPRHLSFSVAADAILGWEDIAWSAKEEPASSTDPNKQLYREQHLADEAKRIRKLIAQVGGEIGTWVEDAVTGLETLDEKGDHDLDELKDLLHPRMLEYSSIREESSALLRNEKADLTEVVKDLEVLQAKLEYEFDSVRSKVEEVEAGVGDFERQVKYMEDRVTELEDSAKEKEGWAHWMFRIVTGGSQPPVEGKG